jgi:glycine dehydrogenase
MAAAYTVWHGPEGLARIARRVHAQAEALREALDGIGGVAPRQGPLFDTLAVTIPGRARAVVDRANELGLRLWLQDEDTVYLSADEATTDRDLRDAVAAFGGDPGTLPHGIGHTSPDAAPPAPAATLGFGKLAREAPFLTHPVFHRHRSELAMTRYLKALADRDYAMDRGMIPLGSCTMKLNAATELAAVTWPQFGAPHPFGPAADARGTRELLAELTADLLELTGYDNLSLQPNAGSQGELAGLLAIRGYHRARGEGARDVCLIPVSAHGTNAASAALAGYRVVGVAADPAGNVSLDD